LSAYLAFELDALNVVPSVAAACNLKPADVSHGLLQLWARCFRLKTDHVTTVHIRGFFGANGCEALVCEALLAFDFIAETETGWRVRGAERYLRVAAGRSAGGKAAAKAGNLKRGSQRPGAPAGTPDAALPPHLPSTFPAPPSTSPVEPHTPPAPPSTSPVEPSTFPVEPSTPPSTSQLFQRAASTEQRTANSKREEPSRNRELSDALMAAYAEERGEPYGRWSEADGTALPRLVRRATTNPPIVARWRKALRLGSRYPGCSTIAQFDSKWRDLGATDAPPKGSIDPSTQNHVSGVIIDF